MPVYDNFINTKTEKIMKSPENKNEIIGGFCGIIVGFIEKDKHYIVMTVKGSDWGDNGFIFIPYDLLNVGTIELCCIDIKQDLIKLELNLKDKNNNINNFNLFL